MYQVKYNIKEEPILDSLILLIANDHHMATLIGYMHEYEHILFFILEFTIYK